MPDEALDQGQTIDDLILDILADEAQIIRCLRVFFCDTLQDLSQRYAHCPELKIRLADSLITAAAKKEEALAKVLEAISLFEAELDEWIPLAPGASYPLPPEPSIINRIMFDAKTDAGTSSVIEASIYGTVVYSDSVIEVPKTIDWTFSTGVPIEFVELTNTGSNTIYIRNLTTE